MTQPMTCHTYSAPAPWGELRFWCDGTHLYALALSGQRGYVAPRPSDVSLTLGEATALPIEQAVHLWLDTYFGGEIPASLPPIRLVGSPFQLEVWSQLLDLPYGTVTTYGCIAEDIARKRGIPRMAAQAIGGAIRRNPVSIILPCHRVIGRNGDMIGYTGGLHFKTALLELERSVSSD